jgi:hypothetical protein
MIKKQNKPLAKILRPHKRGKIPVKLIRAAVKKVSEDRRKQTGL